MPGPSAKGSRARKISPHNFWLQNPSSNRVSGRNFWSPKQFLLKSPHIDLLRLIPFELLNQGNSLKGTSGIQGGTEVSGIKVGARGPLSPRQKEGQRPLSFF